ncbi:MAG: hypothetical protein C0501_30045 [Isosphaera sp.]|nr:hypothetical protein [Isosphaera sp.]
MGGLFARPRVADLVFRVYDRPLHPELFDVLAARAVTRDGYTLTARLTRTGHAAGWTDGRVYVEEVTATRDMDLPARGWRLGHRPGGGGRCGLGGGVRYAVRSQVEVLAPEQYPRAHEELAADGARKGLVFHCRGGDRLGLAPLGVLIATAVAGGLSLAAFHTFPDELAVVKTQSLIEWG